MIYDISYITIEHYYNIVKESVKKINDWKQIQVVKENIHASIISECYFDF